LFTRWYDVTLCPWTVFDFWCHWDFL
jgi:hypothetical protein